MSNNTRRRMRRRKPKLSTEGRRWVDNYSADELHRFLVTDAVKSHATDLEWAVAAYERIGKLRRTGPESAYQDVRAEVTQLRGRPGMPLG